jgi:hypothetical protein
MSDDRLFDRTARAWLELGPTKAPDHTVESALLTIESTAQERDVRIPWRLPKMNPAMRLVVFAAVAVLATGGALYLSQPPVSSVGTSPPPASSSRPSTPVATSAPSASLTSIPDGVYAGPTLQATGIVAAINADAALSGAQKKDLIDNAFAIRGASTWSASIEINRGRWTQRQTVDGVTQIGSGGKYTLLDDRTVALQETSGGSQSVSGFQITWQGTSFTLKSLTAPSNAKDAFAETTLFESGPFTLVP